MARTVGWIAAAVERIRHMHQDQTSAGSAGDFASKKNTQKHGALVDDFIRDAESGGQRGSPSVRCPNP
jgi:hypothetical protein